MTLREETAFITGLARRAVETYIREGRILSPPKLEEILPVFRKRAAVFVSIKKQGQLRGCIGTITPLYSSVCEEVIHDAISAAVEDPRFEPVKEEEFSDLKYSVDVLSPLQKVKRMKDLNPKKYGVLVRANGRHGLLLPDIEGIHTVELQVEIARRKGGIGPNERVTLYRFTVKRYSEMEEKK